MWEVRWGENSIPDPPTSIAVSHCEYIANYLFLLFVLPTILTFFFKKKIDLFSPKALLLHLKRFVPGVNIPFRKNKDPITLSESLSLDAFLSENTVDEKKNLPSHKEQQYSLKSLVHHIGPTASSGHYTADAARTRPATPEEADKKAHEEWVSFDDSRATVTKLSDIVASEPKKKTAYMLLYTLDC